MDDKALIEKLKTDPEGGVRALISLYGGLTAAVVRGVLGGRGFSDADIEAAAADTVSEFWLGLEKFDPRRGTVRGYLAAAARHNALDLLRSRNAPEPLDEGAPDPSPGPEERALDAQRRREVLAAVRALGQPDREIIVRKYYLGQSSAQVASALGMTAGNVDVRTHRAVTKLKKLLGDDEDA